MAHAARLTLIIVIIIAGGAAAWLCARAAPGQELAGPRLLYPLKIHDLKCVGVAFVSLGAIFHISRQ